MPLFAGALDIMEPPHRPRPAEWVKATIRVSREDSSDFATKDVRLAFDPPAAGLKSVERAAVRMSDWTWQADGIDIPRPGIWTVCVIIATDGAQTIVLDAPT